MRKTEASVLVSAGHFFLREDRLTELAEICEAAKALTCVLKLPPSYWLWEDAGKKLEHFNAEWEKQTACPLAMDPGRSGIPDSLKSKSLQWIWDPLWLGAGPRSSSVWRIHGWHEGRWVRRYSHEQLSTLAQAIQKCGPRFVILCHSQRAAQFSELRKMLARN